MVMVEVTVLKISFIDGLRGLPLNRFSIIHSRNTTNET